MVIKDLIKVFKSKKIWVFILFMILISLYGLYLWLPSLNPLRWNKININELIREGVLNQFAIFSGTTILVYSKIIPIVAPFVYGTTFLRERKSGFDIFIDCRMSDLKYRIYRFFINGIVGGLSVILPIIIIFYFINVFIGGNINDTKQVLGGIVYDVMMENPYGYVALVILIEFCVGFAYSTISLGVSTVIDNEIIVLLFPGIFYFVSSYVTEILRFPLPLKTKIVTDFGILVDGVSVKQLLLQTFFITLIFSIVFFYFSRKEYRYER
ncbi:hypothetical protein ACV3RS_14875 [Clostridium perfringens]